MPLNNPHCFGLSHVGRVRMNNEDQFLISDLSKSMVIHHSTSAMADETRLFSDVQGRLLLVADGMGGHAAGERASELTMSTISNYVLQTMPWFFRLQREDEDHLHDELEAAARRCEQAVHDEALANPREHGMGTTLTFAYILWPRMFVVHVGDSRCYLLRSGQLKQVTRDDTLLRDFQEQGFDLNEETRRHFGRVLINSIGRGVEKLNPEVYKVELEMDDLVMLCSDGLSDQISDDEITAILNRNSTDERQMCEELVAAANDAGGVDNVTVVVSRFQCVLAGNETVELPSLAQSETC